VPTENLKFKARETDEYKGFGANWFTVKFFYQN